MAARAREVAGQGIALLIGGFHLGSASREEIERVAEALRGLGVERVAPGHCTGDDARSILADDFGEDCVLIRVGQSIRIGSAVAIG